MKEDKATAMRVKDTNYVTIQAFMVNDLHLGGNELIIYAAIYGFSQDGFSWFSGSRAYLSHWCQASTMTVSTNLKKLLEKGLIEKRTRIENNVTFADYRVCQEPLGVIKNLYWGSKETLGGTKESLAGGSKESLHHKLDTDKTNDKTKDKGIPTFEEVAEYIKQMGYGLDPAEFYDANLQSGWRLNNGNPVKDWKARVRTFERYRKQREQKQNAYSKPSAPIVQHETAGAVPSYWEV